MRSLGEASSEIVDLVVSGEGEAEELVELAEQKIYAVRNSKEHKGLASISSVLMDVYDQMCIRDRKFVEASPEKLNVRISKRTKSARLILRPGP